jgi:hypothetical protein
MHLFAQANFNNNAGIDPAVLPVLIGVMCVAMTIGLAIAIAFYLTLSKALSRCKARNRTMEPGQVWLNLIPVFGIFWIFVTVSRISESLKNEYYDRGWDERGDFGKQIGLAFPICSLLGIIPFIGPLFSLGSLICLIMYWVKIAGFSKELAGGGGRAADDDDDYDDRPRGRSRGRDDDDDDYDDDRPRKRR